MSDLANQTTAEKVLDLIGYSQAALEKAHRRFRALDKQAAAIAEKIPQVVEALVENDRIDPRQREKAAQQLRDPVRALEILMAVAQHRNAAELSHLGKPVAKTAGPRRSVVVGERHYGPSEADIRYFERLGLAVPTE